MNARSRTAFAAAALLGAIPIGHAQDALRIRQLESEVQRLDREIQAQARRIDQLEQSARSASAGPLPVPPSLRQSAADNSPAWLLGASWDKVRPGMKELDVIALLGRPTSVRTDEDGKTHTLLYALELGSNAVLAGNVELTESGVVAINRPVLR